MCASELILKRHNRVNMASKLMMKISALSRQYYALLDGCFLVCSSNYLVFSNINQNGFSKFCKLKLNTEVTPLPVPWVFSKHSTLVTKLNFVTLTTV